MEYIFPIQLIARLSYLGFVVFPVCSQDATNLLPKMATNSCNLHANKQMPKHAPWKDYFFFLGSLFLSHCLRDVFFSTIMSTTSMREGYWKAEGKRMPSEEREIYRSFCCYCENWRIWWHRFRHHTCYGIIFDNLTYPMLKIESAKIMCFLKFSIAKIWPKFKKKHQIFIDGSSR